MYYTYCYFTAKTKPVENEHHLANNDGWLLNLRLVINNRCVLAFHK